jgi:hypothetical protein
MTTTARVSSTTNPSVAYTFSVASGSTATFAAFGLSEEERIIFEVPDSSSNYKPLTYVDGAGRHKTAELSTAVRTIKITGPVDARINKPATASAVEIVEYT